MIVVSNTSPITNLAAIGQLELLRRLYREIYVPLAVIDELHAEGRSWPGTAEVDSADWVRRQKVANVDLVRALSVALGQGESEAIALAIELGADLVILDDSDGRKVAAGFHLKIIGVVGVLLEAKAAGAIDSLKPHLGRLKREAGFFLSPKVEQQALRLAGEV